MPARKDVAADYWWFSIGIAACGGMMAIAFFLIELRNAELVNCGREWLERLELNLSMDIRARDRDRLHKSRIATCLKLPEFSVKHFFWIRFIYIVAFVAFARIIWFAYSKLT